MNSVDDVLTKARARQREITARTGPLLAKLGVQDGTPAEVAMHERDARALRKIVAFWRANPRYAPRGRTTFTAPSGRVHVIGEKGPSDSNSRSMEKRPFRARQRRAVAS